MAEPHVYDKMKYHLEAVQGYALPDEHAANHTVCFLRWLIENDLMSVFFEEESDPVLAEFRAGKTSIHDVYDFWDGCLVNDMLSDEGNRFALYYFDFAHGQYLRDYIALLQGQLPSEYHVTYNERNYQRLKARIDRHYQQWRAGQKKRP
jgi:hypothetical protein